MVLGCVVHQRLRQHRQCRRFDDAHQRSQQCRVDDAPQTLLAGNRQRINRDHPFAGQDLRKVRRTARRIHHNQRSLIGGCEQPAFQQAGVKTQNGIGALDVAAHPHRALVNADVGVHGCAAARSAVTGKALHMQALRMERARQQVAGSLSTLATATLDDDLKHLVVSFSISVCTRTLNRFPYGCVSARDLSEAEFRRFVTIRLIDS